VESACAEEGTDEGEERREVVEPTFESHTLNADASLRMSGDVDMMEAPAEVVNQEQPVNITGHEQDGSVSLRYVKFRGLY
jgi:hypothetical protein